MTATRKTAFWGYDHVYQITADQGICFYTVADCLVWFTLLCVLSRRYRIRVLAVCIMLNHYHIELHAPSAEALSSFMRDLNALYTRLYNRQYGLSGPLFCNKFKNACKNKEQKVRENFLYVCNNPVVKCAVPRAEQYRWNFLAYMQETHPCPSMPNPGLDNRIEQVRSMIRVRRSAGRPLDYAFFDGIYSSLSVSEKKEAVDYAIVLYNVIDYDAVKHMWGSYGQLCRALETVRGSEYDIDDDMVQEDYRHYYRMIRVAAGMGYDLAKMRFSLLPPEEKKALADACRREVGATRVELRKFLQTT